MHHVWAYYVSAIFVMRTYERTGCSGVKFDDIHWSTSQEIVDLEGKDIVQCLSDAWELVGLVASSYIQWHVGRSVSEDKITYVKTIYS